MAGELDSGKREMRQFVSRYRLLVFYAVTFIISWIAWGIMFLVYDGEQPGPVTYVFSTLGGLGPLLALIFLQKVTQQEISLKQILSKIRIRETFSVWGVLAIVGLPLITVLGNLGNFLVNQEGHLQIITTGPDELGIFVLPVMMLHFTASLITSPLFEEPGWRGFALGQLQEKYGRTLGSLVVALLWWIWHQPMNITFGLMPSAYSMLSMIVLSFIIDSLFNLSDRNLFMAMLAHQSSGTVNIFINQGNQNWMTLILKAIFLIVIRWIESKKEFRE